MEWVSSLGRHSLRAAGLVPRTVWCVGGCSATEGCHPNIRIVYLGTVPSLYP